MHKAAHLFKGVDDKAGLAATSDQEQAPPDEANTPQRVAAQQVVPGSPDRDDTGDKDPHVLSPDLGADSRDGSDHDSDWSDQNALEQMDVDEANRKHTRATDEDEPEGSRKRPTTATAIDDDDDLIHVTGGLQPDSPHSDSGLADKCKDPDRLPSFTFTLLTFAQARIPNARHTGAPRDQLSQPTLFRVHSTEFAVNVPPGTKAAWWCGKGLRSLMVSVGSW